jgi:hypothetical protein
MPSNHKRLKISPLLNHKKKKLHNKTTFYYS